MKRRDILLAGAAGVLGAGRAVAQPAGRSFRVLVLHSAPITSGPYHAALRDRMAMQGLVGGKNLVLETPLLTVTGLAFMRQDLARLIKQKPDAIFAFTARVTDSALAEAPDVPVVFIWVDDPVKAGLVKDYSRPGGNATGVANRFAEVAGKRLELLHELAPAVKRVAVAGPTYQPEGEAAMAVLRAAAGRLGVDLVEIGAHPGQLTLEIQGAIRNGAQAVLPLLVFSTLGYRDTGAEIVRLCAANRVPAIFAESEMVEVGALASYGTNLLDDVRRGADMLVKILRGSKPGEIPIDQASQFELALNLRTARQMEMRVPPSILARASRVIE